MMNRVSLIYRLLFLVFVLAINAGLGFSQDASIKRTRVFKAHSEPVQTVSDTTPRWGTTSYIEKEVFRLINEEREKQGLKPLVWNDRVADMARQHSKSMAERHFFSHVGKDGLIVSNRADKAGIKWISIGENIVSFNGAIDPSVYAVDCWMHSPDHKTNILTKGWKQTGIGAIVAPDGSYYLTQVFLY